jgi:hypothetical protein
VDIANLNSFLTLGYFLDYKNKDIKIDVSHIDKEKYKDISEQELIEIGSKLWRESISNNFQVNSKHLVPISGGLDSRATLAGLLEHTEAKNIHTYTFGTPNTLDYDVGNYIAKKLGTNHTSFDLTKYAYKQEELENISKRIHHQAVLFHHWPVWELDALFKGCIQWSGFMGDPLAGSHLSSSQSHNLEEAKTNFIKKNKYVKSIKLSNNDDFSSLINNDLIDKDKLTLDEQLDFQNRQTKYISSIVLMKGYDLKTPFLYQPYIDFMLSVDNKHRINQNLYKKILLNAFPKEFSYKTKTNFGLPLGASNNAVFINRVKNKILRMIGLSKGIGINYLDFNEKIRTKKDLRDVISMNILDLKRRDIIDWIDIEKILNDHLSNKGNFADALIVLASLEIHLKAGKVL